MKNPLIPYIFNILALFFLPFSWQIIHLKNVMCTLLRGEAWGVYVLYTNLNVDNYGWPLSQFNSIFI